MFEKCRQLQISLNLKKCIFVVPFETLLGHIVCKDGVCVDPVKVAEIVNMEPPNNVKQLPSHWAIQDITTDSSEIMPQLQFLWRNC